MDTLDLIPGKDRSDPLHREVQKCHLLWAPGPHVLLLVTQLRCFTVQDQQAVRRVKTVFGEGAIRHTTVLFSHKEDREGGSWMAYIHHSGNKALGRLAATCRGQPYALNNRAKGNDAEDQVKKLMDLMERSGDPCTNELYSLATELECGREWSEERLEDFKGSLIKYMERQR